MNAKYLRAVATAKRLIKNNGAQFQWRRVTKVRDPLEETETEEVLTQTVWAVVLPPANDPFSSKIDQYVGPDGVLNLSKVRKVLISPEGNTFKPTPQDQMFHQGEWWTFEQSSELAPDGETDIMFKGTIRRT